jgi:hypothetical protein
LAKISGDLDFVSKLENNMNPLIGMIASQLGGPAVGQIAQQIGSNSGATQSAINMALPMMLSAMGNHAAGGSGADDLHQAARNHDHSIIDDVMGFLGNAQGGNVGNAMLGQFLGGNDNAIANVIGQQSGIGSGAAMQLMAILGPIVMAALGRSSQSNGLDADGMAQMLGAAAGSSGGNDLLGVATKMLDADGDGNVMEDISSLIGKIL